jgi:hypothetical protein
LSKKSPKTIADVRAAFDSRSILRASPRELEELLSAAACEQSDDPAVRAQLREMGETMRQLHAAKAPRKPSRLAVAAAILALAALLTSGAQAYRSMYGRDTFAQARRTAMGIDRSVAFDQTRTDLRTQTTIAELAQRAPSLRTGTLQAWWAGEQARQVERLEAQAKRQTLAGDRDGAARSARRADAIRSRIPALADSERPAAQ